MLILNFTYPLRCLRVPPVECHWSKGSVSKKKKKKNPMLQRRHKEKEEEVFT
jgi:hypothetical protein